MNPRAPSRFRTDDDLWDEVSALYEAAEAGSLPESKANTLYRLLSQLFRQSQFCRRFGAVRRAGAPDNPLLDGDGRLPNPRQAKEAA